MKSALITIKTKPELKQNAQKIADHLGFSLSSVINGYLVSFVKNKTIYFSDSDENNPTDYLMEVLESNKKDKKNKDYHSFKNGDDALVFLDKIISKKECK